MFNGAHFLLNSSNPEADRAFLRDVLGFKAVDIGRGWLIFALPPAELAVHPTSEPGVQRHAGGDAGFVLYLMCDDVKAVVATLEANNVACAPIDEAPWGQKTSVTLPSGGTVGIYQPSHATALGL